ncbi:hypothetical protein [Microbacterium sp. GXF7504]
MTGWRDLYDKDDPDDRRSMRALARFERDIDAAHTPEAISAAVDRLLRRLERARRKRTTDPADNPRGTTGHPATTAQENAP